ncbi:MAG TPA: PAS domain-containing protein, partial [Candidatus Acidoferrales bacterium]|nr:PAS domain-containing protein [Candidatus Acidoferrales bacterium]
DEVAGKTDADFYPAELAGKYREEEAMVMDSGRPLIREEKMADRQTGKTVWLRTTKLPWRDESGQTAGLIGRIEDITEQKTLEEELRRLREGLEKRVAERTAEISRERSLLRTIIDISPDAIYIKDRPCHKTMANPAELKFMGCKTEAEAIGKTDFEIYPEELARGYYADDHSVIEGGNAVLNREEKVVSPNGEVRWVLSSKIPLRDADGKVAGLVGLGRDITERRQAEQLLRESEAKLRDFAGRLERSNRELQDFAYVASHDLQEPLRKIIVFGERLKQKNADKLDADSLNYLERMQQAGTRMQNLINDLLSYSRVTSKAQAFTKVDLAQVARGVIEDLEGRIETVHGRVEVGALPVVEGEPLQMRQLLQNLIGNALKFRRPDAPPHVRVEAEIVAGNGQTEGKICRLTVSDNGIGFEEKHAERIFELFQRLHARHEYEGTGMGLAIVRKIAVRHGGDVVARSKPGEGATFVVTIPMTHEKASQEQAKT